MAKTNNQKGKILYLEKILRGTGENRTVSMQEILAELSKYGVTAERKSIYDDIEVLRSFGMDILYRRGKPGGYYLAGERVEEHLEAPEDEAAETKRQPEEQMGAQPEKSVPAAVHSFVKLSGEENAKTLRLLCARERMGEVRECFGALAQYKVKGEDGILVTVQVEESPQFYGWLTSMGRDVRIWKPKKAAQSYREYLKGLVKEYKGI